MANLRDCERSEFSQTNLGAVLNTSVGRFHRGGAERVWVCTSGAMPSCVETGNRKLTKSDNSFDSILQFQ